MSGSIDRARETRVLWALLDSAGQPRERVDEIDADEDTWTQLRLWLAFTDDNDRVAAGFRVNVGRPREVVSAWGGITEDLALVPTTHVRLGVCLASTYTRSDT